MASSLEIMHSAPYAEVAYFDEAKPYGTLTYHVKVDRWENTFGDRGKESYKTLPGDILLLSYAKPESLSDMRHLGRMWAFGSVINISDDDEEDSSNSSHFKIEVSKDLEFKDGGKSLFVVFLMNITTNNRIWKALQMLRNLNIINKVLCIKGEVKFWMILVVWMFFCIRFQNSVGYCKRCLSVVFFVTFFICISQS